MIEIKNLRAEIQDKNNKWINYISEDSFTSIICGLFIDEGDEFYRIKIEDKDNRFTIDLYSLDDVNDCYEELKRLMLAHAENPLQLHTLDLCKYKPS